MFRTTTAVPVATEVQDLSTLSAQKPEPSPSDSAASVTDSIPQMQNDSPDSMQQSVKSAGLSFIPTLFHLGKDLSPGKQDQLHQAYLNIMNFGLNFALKDSALNEASKRVNGDVYIVPIDDIKNSPGFLQNYGFDLGSKQTDLELLAQMNGDAVTFSAKDHMTGKASWLTFIEKDVFDRLMRTTVTLRHELHHVLNDLPPETPKSTERNEIQACEATIQFIDILRADLKSGPQHEHLEKWLEDLKVLKAQETAMLKSWQNALSAAQDSTVAPDSSRNK